MRKRENIPSAIDTVAFDVACHLHDRCKECTTNRIPCAPVLVIEWYLIVVGGNSSGAGALVQTDPKVFRMVV